MSFPARVEIHRTTYRCPHYSLPVKIESKVAYPGEVFAEMPQRILGRTCSDEFNCVLIDKSACPMRIQQIRLQTLQ